MNQNQITSAAITRYALSLVKQASNLNEKEGLPFLKLSSYLIKTAADVGYGLDPEVAVFFI
jgi:hypothetical protein